MQRYNPVSTYRLQFNRHFTFKEGIEIIPYLSRSGIKTLYSSPLLEAVRGSMHGYDVTNPLRINPEIGSSGNFEEFTDKLSAYKMGLILDIVPNHMAYSTENPWINDILEKGVHSPYYLFFDILEDHPDPDLNNRLMLPFFGKPGEEMIRDNELSVIFTEEGFKLVYFEDTYPLSVPAYPFLLEAETRNDIPLAVAAFMNAEKKPGEFNELRERLVVDYSDSPATKAYVDQCVSGINNDPEKFKKLTDTLYYSPSFWKASEEKINYRRFFTINSLICMNIQDPEVFEKTHKLIRTWIERGLIKGLRVDHIDGLYDCGEYLDRLRKLAGQTTWIGVEKILGKEESLPREWPVEGTTGYDFLGMVNNLLTNPEKGPVLYGHYKEWTGETSPYTEVFYRKNRFILYNRLKGELDNLTRECMNIPQVKKQYPHEQKLKKAIGEFLIFCPVYKVYGTPSTFSESDKKLVAGIFREAVKGTSENRDALQFLEDLFFLKYGPGDEETAAVNRFFRHCMQFTGPLMAKGIEDTAFYSYNPFIVHNEVGDSPAFFGITVDSFHKQMIRRQEMHPLTLNAISTHDTKRGEDARARLIVLGDIPGKWIKATKEWRRMNRIFKQHEGEKEVPTPNDEYFIYQVLCAHLPMDATVDESFTERMDAYLIKAMREGKENSTWRDPDEYYEKTTLRFARDILSPSSPFPESFLRFMEELIPHGIVNSLTQLILKNLAPGVPDTFQGTETWSLSFVDPDNRRDVDYSSLTETLDQLIDRHESQPAVLAGDLWQQAEDGKIKQWMNWVTLKERVNDEDLFLKGDYTPLVAEGKYRKHVMAFYRHFEEAHLIVVLPLNTASMPADLLWEDTWIEVPAAAPGDWENRLTGHPHAVADQKLFLDTLFEVIPFGVLRSVPA